jgi:hypothetical protein
MKYKLRNALLLNCSILTWSPPRGKENSKIMMASVLEMDFIMTALIHPLKNALLLSERLGVYLDNPRTEEEVDAIESYIRKFGSLGYTVECTTQLYLD